MSDPLNPAALHVRIVNPDGATEDICLASFVKNNEHDEIALYALGLALCQAGEDPRTKTLARGFAEARAATSAS